MTHDAECRAHEGQSSMAKDGICSQEIILRRFFSVFFCCGKSKMTANVPCKNCYKICAEICQGKRRKSGEIKAGKKTKPTTAARGRAKSDKSPTLMMIFFSLSALSSELRVRACVAKQLIKIKNDFIIYFSSDNGRHDGE